MIHSPPFLHGPDSQILPENNMTSDDYKVNPSLDINIIISIKRNNIFNEKPKNSNFKKKAREHI